MKPIYLLIILSVLSVSRVYAACFARCFGKVPDKCSGEIFETVEKRNNRLPKEIILRLNGKNTATSVHRFIDAEKNLLWTLEAPDNDCIEFEKSVIKQSHDPDPLTWVEWPLKPLNEGKTLITLSCVCKNKNKILKVDEVRITVVDE
jgi:hypothetical protein